MGACRILDGVGKILSEYMEKFGGVCRIFGGVRGIFEGFVGKLYIEFHHTHSLCRRTRTALGPLHVTMCATLLWLIKTSRRWGLAGWEGLQTGQAGMDGKVGGWQGGMALLVGWLAGWLECL